MATVLSSPMKRARAVGGQIASCLVDGCMSDLSKCRDYYRKHKVCEVHSKMAIVMIAGREQRFCQQCSKFHLLVEFDEMKRSCRKRLDEHNQRRRKPQPDPLSSGSFIMNHQGEGSSSYTQILSAAKQPLSAEIIKMEDELLYTDGFPCHLIDGHQFPVPSQGSYKGEKQFPFLQDTVAATAASSSSSNRMLLESDIALSLLSSSLESPHVSCISLSQIVEAGATANDRFQIGEPLVPCGQYSESSILPTGFSFSEMEEEHIGTVLVSDGSDGHARCRGLFNVGNGGYLHDEISQSVPFSWQQ